MKKEQREEYAKLHGECGALIAKAAEEKREQTGEEKTAQAARYARMDTLKAQADEEKKLALYAFEHGAADPTPAPKGKEEFDRTGGGNRAPSPKPNAGDEKAQFTAAFNHYMRTGERTHDNYTIVTTTNGGILVPKSVMPPEDIRRNNNAFRAAIASQGYEPIETTSTEQLVLPIFDDTGNSGAVLTEGATSGTTADVSTAGSLTLNAPVYTSKQRWFSNSVLNANGFNILSYITPVVQKAVDKAEEAAWTTTLTGLTATVGVTTTSDAAVTYPQIMTWEHSLAVAYRSDAVFLFSDSLYHAIRGLVDANGRPIMDLDPTNVFQAKLHGKPVFVSDYMAPMGTANGIAGAFLSADAIKIRTVTPQRLTKYINVPQFPDQTGWELFENADCQFIPNGVSLLKLFSS